MINIRTIRKLQENDGLTLKRGRVITYKSGWQVADYGYKLETAEAAIACVRKLGGIYRNMSDENISYEGLDDLDDTDEGDLYTTMPSKESEIFAIKGNKKDEKRRLKEEEKARKEALKQQAKEQPVTSNVPDWLRKK